MFKTKSNIIHETFKIIFERSKFSRTIICRYTGLGKQIAVGHCNPDNQGGNIGKAHFKVDNLIISSSLIFSEKLDQLFLVTGTKFRSFSVYGKVDSLLPHEIESLHNFDFQREIAAITFHYSLYCNSVDTGLEIL